MCWNTSNKCCEPWGWMDECYTYDPCCKCDTWDIDLETIALIIIIILGILLIIAILLPFILGCFGSI